MPERVAEPVPDQAERLRALDPTGSFIVQAPAGSGKTELLIQRFLTLLGTVDHPESIVAITFTRKAAGEMRHRVIGALERSEEAPETRTEHECHTWELSKRAMKRDRELKWQLIEHPSRLRIQTIDALCASLVRQMPWTSRMGAPPQPEENVEHLYHQAARRTLEMLDSKHASVAPVEALTRLVTHLDNDLAVVGQLLGAMLRRRDQWLRYVVRNPTTAAFREAMELAVTDIVRDELAKHAPEDTRVARVRTLPPTSLGESQWEILCALMELLPVAVGQLKLVFQAAGRVDFTEIAHASRTALGPPDAPTDLAFALDCRIQHLLVDEFQDTSQSQYDLLESLTAEWQPDDGRTLFLVGDPMQSIYGFREADVALYLRARTKGVGSVRLTPLTLAVNFRSNAGIVDWVNQGLGEAFPVQEDMLTGAVTYEPSVAFDSDTSPAWRRDSHASLTVVVHPFFDNDPAHEAERVVEIIQKAQAADPEGTIAVLVRSRSQLFATVAALRRAGQRFRAVEIDALGTRPVVQDLLALTRALLHPADRVAWLSILRAPWCGLTLADLNAVVGGDFTGALWDLIQDPTSLARMSSDGRIRLERVRKVLEGSIPLSGTLPVRRWVEATWIRLGGPACLENPTDREDAAAFLDLLEESVRGAGLVNEQKFVEDVHRLFARPDVEADERLQLLTIHKAKGLEFDTVILPGLGRTTRPESRSLMMWLEYIDRQGRSQLLLAPIKETGADNDPLYAYLWYIQGKKQDHESTRLLYVAATRARKRLHLMGHTRIEPNSGAVKLPASRSLLRKIWNAVEGAFEDVVERGQGTRVHDDESGPVSAAGVPLRRLSSGWQSVPPPPDIVWQPMDGGSGSNDAADKMPTHPTFHWASELPRRVGRVVHAMLRRTEARAGGRIRQDWNRETILAALASEGLNGDKLHEAACRVHAALEGTVTDDRGLWILSEHEDDQREYSLSGVVDGRVRRFVLDRTFIESGVRWIIDYKTGTHEGGGMDAFLDNEQIRYRDQLESYARAMRHIDSHPIRLGLYFPLLQEWREWEFAAAGLVRTPS